MPDAYAAYLKAIKDEFSAQSALADVRKNQELKLRHDLNAVHEKFEKQSLKLEAEMQAAERQYAAARESLEHSAVGQAFKLPAKVRPIMEPASDLTSAGNAFSQARQMLAAAITAAQSAADAKAKAQSQTATQAANALEARQRALAEQNKAKVPDVQPQPAPLAPEPPPPTSKVPIFVGIGIAAAIAIVALLFFIL